MKVNIEIDVEDLKALYNAYKVIRYTSMSVQDWNTQCANEEQFKRIQHLVAPIIDMDC